MLGSFGLWFYLIPLSYESMSIHYSYIQRNRECILSIKKTKNKLELIIEEVNHFRELNKKVFCHKKSKLVLKIGPKNVYESN